MMNYVGMGLMSWCTVLKSVATLRGQLDVSVRTSSNLFGPWWLVKSKKETCHLHNSSPLGSET